MKKDNILSNELKGKKITRKEAIKKAGLGAFSAATLMVLLSEEVSAHRGGRGRRNCGGQSSPAGNSGSSSSGDWGSGGSSDD